MEVELKLHVDEGRLPALRERLAQLGARPEAPRTQDDLFFQHPCRDLAATDEALRCRRENGGLELTYKGARLKSDTKAREEVNLAITSDPEPILRMLGFTPAARLRKTREPWHVDGAEVAIDHVEGVGWFVEIEAKDHPDPHGHVESLQQVLGLSDAPSTTTSYLEMAVASGAQAVDEL